MSHDLFLSIVNKEVSDYFEIDALKIFDKTRKHMILIPRQWFHFLARQLQFKQNITLSYQYIGEYASCFTNVKYDHATVMNSCKVIGGFVSVNKEERLLFELLSKRIKDKLKLRDMNLENMSLKPKNRYQQVLWYLINWRYEFDLLDVINHSRFYKFQTRLGEIEDKHEIIVERKQKPFINGFGNPDFCTTYKCINEKKAMELFYLYK